MKEVIVIKAQYSMEFILIFAFSLIVIIPIINLMHEHYSNSVSDLDQSQAKEILDKIAINVQSAYYSGYPTRMTLEPYFPKGIIDIYVETIVSGESIKSELVFKVKRGSEDNELVALFPFNVTENLTINSGKRRVLIKVERTDNEKEYVNITDMR